MSESMERILYLVLVVLGGLAAGSQAPINAELGKRIGSLEAAFLSFAIGTLGLAFSVAVIGRGQLRAATQVPVWMLSGGLLGAAFVTTVILTVPKLGATLTIFAAIIGQVIAGVLIDHYGLFGVARLPIALPRIIGVVLMLAGLAVTFRGWR